MDLHHVRTPYVVVGGVATALYMPQRMTLDLDILVNPVDAPRLHQELTAAGLNLVGPLAFGGTSWRTPAGDILDVLETDEPWIQDAVHKPNSSPSGMPIIALPFLVLMKLAANRAQDIADLTRMLGQADEATRQQVREAVRTYRPEDSGDLESLIALGDLELSRG